MKKEKQTRHCKNCLQISIFSILWRVRERAPVGKGLATQARGSEFSLKHPHRKLYPKRWCVLVLRIPVLGRQKQKGPWGPVTDSPSLSATLMFH